MDLIPAGLIVHRTFPGDVEVMVLHNAHMTFASKHIMRRLKTGNFWNSRCIRRIGGGQLEPGRLELHE